MSPCWACSSSALVWLDFKTGSFAVFTPQISTFPCIAFPLFFLLFRNVPIISRIWRFDTGHNFQQNKGKFGIENPPMRLTPGRNVDYNKSRKEHCNKRSAQV
jgi:hypothetical protein